jgi:hypothetical protein
VSNSHCARPDLPRANERLVKSLIDEILSEAAGES